MADISFYLLLLLSLGEWRRILIFTSNLTIYPRLSSFLSDYDFGIVGEEIEEHNVGNRKEIDDIMKLKDYYYTIDFTEDV